MDWLAIAITVLPLMLMAMFVLTTRAQRSVGIERPSIASHGELVRDTAPMKQGAAAPVQVVATAAPSPPVPQLERGRLIEDQPLVAGPTHPVQAVAAADPLTRQPLEPWRDAFAQEDIAVAPGVGVRTSIVPVTGMEMASAAALPICLPDAPLSAVSDAGMPLVSPPSEPMAFGRALAAAARAQIDGFVIYNARYMTIAYPQGDTQPLYGVCTDVVIRAYRALGIDLQELIHTSRLGRGDPSIDHRRVEVVRRFMERYGTSLEISEFAEDYWPGDIVTYHRPQGRVSQHHVAVVSDRFAPSGRPLVVHNRGWGPQLEDALFVDRITGHYRLVPGDVALYASTRQPGATGRHRTADVVSTKRR